MGPCPNHLRDPVQRQKRQQAGLPDKRVLVCGCQVASLTESLSRLEREGSAMAARTKSNDEETEELRQGACPVLFFLDMSASLK